MPADTERTIAVSSDGRSAYLLEGLCIHCGYNVMFCPTNPALVTRVADEQETENGKSRTTEDFLIGVCTRPACRRATVVRRTYEESWSYGDYEGRSEDFREIVYTPREVEPQGPCRKKFQRR